MPITSTKPTFCFWQLKQKKNDSISTNVWHKKLAETWAKLLIESQTQKLTHSVADGATFLELSLPAHNPSGHNTTTIRESLLARLKVKNKALPFIC
jgi:hypothetical protein